MHILPLNFFILQLCGFWRPIAWCSGWKSGLYDCYTIVMLFVLHAFTISGCIGLFASFDNVEEFTHGSFMLLTTIGVCGKTINLVKRRKEIIDLTQVLGSDPCAPRNSEEMEIYLDCERDVRFNALCYAALMGTTASLITLRSVVLDIPQRTLPFKGWFPYEFESSRIGYWFAYFHQLIAHGALPIIICAFDTLVPGLMMHTCAQIKILKYRIEGLPRYLEARTRWSYEKNDDDEHRGKIQPSISQLLTECIMHHDQIYQFADYLNDIFGFVVFLQFGCSSLVLCVSIYKISTMRLFSSESATIILYLTCMLVQIFVYCFYGTELTLEVSFKVTFAWSMDICDSIYRMDWYSFDSRTKKSLIMMMIRALRTIKFTCNSIITVSLGSFTSLIKLSYTTYNALQRMSK